MLNLDTTGMNVVYGVQLQVPGVVLTTTKKPRGLTITAQSNLWKNTTNCTINF